jgi:hypothetical protein
MLPRAVLPPAVPRDDKLRAQTTGYIGESTFISCAVQTGTLNVFHAFPDLDFCEFLIRHVVTGGIHGIQVKCIRVETGRSAGHVHVRLRTFHASSRASVVVFALTGDNRLHEQCLLIPAGELAELCSVSDQYLNLQWDPDEIGPGPLGPYRLRVSALPHRLEQLASRDALGAIPAGRRS